MKKYLFNYQHQSSNSDYIPLNVRQSVFKKKLVLLKKQLVSNKKQARKNLLKKIIQKENQNMVIFWFKIFSVFWIVLVQALLITQMVFSLSKQSATQAELLDAQNITKTQNTLFNLTRFNLELIFIEKGIIGSSLPQDQRVAYIKQYKSKGAQSASQIYKDMDSYQQLTSPGILLIQ